MNNGLAAIREELKNASDPKRAHTLQWFFKTEKGGYGEGDRFLGLTVPVQRKIAHRFRHLTLGELSRLLYSRWHEYRFTALTVLVLQYGRATPETAQQIFDFYLQHTPRINNWDLVDTSAPYIVGQHLLSRRRDVLYQLVQSPDIWERRIAIIATFAFLRAGEVEDTFAISALLLGDKHPLIHKAVGWMLREAGKRDMPRLLNFLEQHYFVLPRTALRYAIERLPLTERKAILRGSFPLVKRNE